MGKPLCYCYNSLFLVHVRRDRSMTNKIPDAMKELDAQLERKLRIATWTPPEGHGTLVEEPRQRPPQPPKRSRIEELKERISRRGEHVGFPLDGDEGVRVHRWEEGETCLSQGQKAHALYPCYGHVISATIMRNCPFSHPSSPAHCPCPSLWPSTPVFCVYVCICVCVKRKTCRHSKP
jgi:hypothetical protein